MNSRSALPLLVLLVSLLLPAGVTAAPSAAASLSRTFDGAAVELRSHVCAGLGVGACDFSGIQREILVGDVAHYRLEVRVGAGEFDRLGIHRVVRETAPWRPVTTDRALMLVHGDAGTFGNQFLGNLLAPGLPREHNLPTFLAQRGLDVWAVDQRWTFLSPELEDLAFTADWGMELHIEDLAVALGVARGLRGLTGSGFGPMDLLGYSRGAQVGYAYVNAETQVPAALRQVRGFVILDVPYTGGTPEARQRSCEIVELLEDLVAGGKFADDFRAFRSLGLLAETTPDDPSPFFPGFTNRQAALFFAASDTVFGGYHLLGGEFDANGLPLGLLYTEELVWFRFNQAGTPFSSPYALQIDVFQVRCGEVDVPFDDHLGEITLPVLFVGSAGGLGRSGLASTEDLTGAELTAEVVAVRPPEEEAFDLGHLDPLLATDADELFWQKILDWVEAN